MKLGIDDYLLKNNLTEESLLDALNKISFEEAENDPTIERLALIGRKKLREDFFHAFDSGGDNLDALAKDAELNLNFERAAVFMIVPINWREREKILNDAERENFLSAFAEMSLNACRNSIGEKINPLIFISNRDGFFHWCLITNFADKSRETAEQLQSFSKLYFNLELKIFLSPPKENLSELSRQWQKIYDRRADSFYSDEKIFSAEDLSPLEIKIGEELKTSGRELVEALSYTDGDFLSVMKIFREELLKAKLHPEILSAYVGELFPEERNLLPSPLQAENFSEWFSRVENFLNIAKRLQAKIFEVNKEKYTSEKNSSAENCRRYFFAPIKCQSKLNRQKNFRAGNFWAKDYHLLQGKRFLQLERSVLNENRSYRSRKNRQGSHSQHFFVRAGADD